MPSPFPGMNPYLENHNLWPSVHHFLISKIAEFLSPLLRPKYIVAVEVRVYETYGENLLVGIPDVTVGRSQTSLNPTSTNVTVAEPRSQPITVEIPIAESIRQGYLEIRDVEKKEVVTVIEILSPVNKRPGDGREAYTAKRKKILGSLTHLVEIDFLRNWQAMPFFSNGIESDYRILVCRSDRLPLADLYAFNLQDKIPKFPIPLKSGDEEPVLDLQNLLHNIYDIAGYDLQIDYSRECVPALSETNAAWVDEVLREQGLR
ncbi:DUF4058 family protein [Phormidium sp. LEGE 05292]|uniref:DUF4058 family protein n=1 Tax=[Phormidium] sp. LEGE 05292 TaxID=767427 RepID=UPI00187EC22E|nr:DUF4058 family protein [Phormidium sp. LEGE 05292]MBE9229280.1 DUF4058 family protein [Phormidium sp. LEGE 05292]